LYKRGPQVWFTAARHIVLFLILVFVLSACSTKPHAIKSTHINVPEPAVVYIVRHGWHTGFVMPANAIQARLPQLYYRFGNTPYIEFGWGDQAYYEADDVTLGLTIRAVFWPTESVIHAVAVTERPDIHFTNNPVDILCLDSKQYSLLLGFIESSFYRDSDGNIIKSKDGSDENSQYYKAEGDYYLGNTCNNWTAKGLKSAGLSISPASKTTAGSIMSYLSKHNKVPANHLCEANSIESSPEP
jgi:uncharacterized protein (TIGR02117 family)